MGAFLKKGLSFDFTSLSHYSLTSLARKRVFWERLLCPFLNFDVLSAEIFLRKLL